MGLLSSVPVTLLPQIGAIHAKLLEQRTGVRVWHGLLQPVLPLPKPNPPPVPSSSHPKHPFSTSILPFRHLLPLPAPACLGQCKKPARCLDSASRSRRGPLSAGQLDSQGGMSLLYLMLHHMRCPHQKVWGARPPLPLLEFKSKIPTPCKLHLATLCNFYCLHYMWPIPVPAG